MSADRTSSAVAAPRTVTVSIDLDAPVELVWQALTDPAMLTQWFPTTAAVDPRPGGAYTISWDGQWQWEMVITDWQPHRRLAMVDREARPFDANGRALAAAAPVTLALEFTLDPTATGTTLRVVQSGFGAGADWDDEIDGVTLGWTVELRGLRHYLRRHRGRTRRTACAHVVVDRPLDRIWPVLVGDAGLVVRCEPASIVEGSAVRLTLATGDAIEGEVLCVVPGRQLVVAQRGDGSLFRLSLDRAAGRSMVQAWWSAWTEPAAAVDEFVGRLRAALDRLAARM
jgi:uncharacterized protein YndB with AHSA1/START domain